MHLRYITNIGDPGNGKLRVVDGPGGGASWRNISAKKFDGRAWACVALLSDPSQSAGAAKLGEGGRFISSIDRRLRRRPKGTASFWGVNSAPPSGSSPRSRSGTRSGGRCPRTALPDTRVLPVSRIYASGRLSAARGDSPRQWFAVSGQVKRVSGAWPALQSNSRTADSVR